MSECCVLYLLFDVCQIGGKLGARWLLPSNLRLDTELVRTYFARYLETVGSGTRRSRSRSRRHDAALFKHVSAIAELLCLQTSTSPPGGPTCRIESIIFHQACCLPPPPPFIAQEHFLHTSSLSTV